MILKSIKVSRRSLVAGEDKNPWAAKYTRRIAVADALVVLWATTGAFILRFGAPEDEEWTSTATQPYLLISIALSLLWWFMLSLFGSRDSWILGHGPEEYKRIISASFWLFGLVAILSYSLQFDTARGYVGLALPAGTLGLLLARFLLRKLLHIERQRGGSSLHVLIIGETHSAEHLARSLIRQPLAGYLPVATYLPGTAPGTTVADDLGLPTIGHGITESAIIKAIKELQPDAVAMSSGVELSPSTIRALGWALADLNVRMIMAPALTDVAGPRIHTQPVAGLPLIHVSTPNLERGQRFIKRLFDLVGASLLVVVLTPVLLTVALLVRSGDQGPVLYRQERVGIGGRHFQMLKFRSMVVGADQQLEQIRGTEEHDGNQVLFKLRQDPRVTKVGGFLRRYSLDELPQLLNVLGGSMSLVGPRPPLATEVERYDEYVHRRLLVRPGMTGLWQVSGRSLLSWEDTVRLDLYYVENWSLFGDLAILLRTFKAVFSRHGAF
jgi:exopolysaccharide biosynthesis polyprenyl glycosylphosphotransferase